MINTLIIVAGHSIYLSNDYDDLYNDKNWLLFDFQKGEPKFYVEHIKKGCALLKESENNFLIFTGGQTRREAKFRSESQTYFEIAKQLKYVNENDFDRVSTEEFSRDSFENLLFPICRFKEIFNFYPSKIKFVTFGFKERRFWLHVEAIKYPKSNVTFYGANNPEDLALAERGENKVINSIKADPYQTNGELLKKRLERNPFKRQNGYAISCPELKELLEYKGNEIFKGKLPWE